MKVYIENKVLSLRGSSSVKDENKNDVYFVKGKLISPTHKKLIMDKDKKVLYIVRNKWFNFFSRSAYIYDGEKTKVAKVKNPPFTNRYVVQGYKDEIEVKGDFFAVNSSIIRNGETMGTIKKDFTFLYDSFQLEASEEDLPLMVALVIAVDNIMDKRTNK